VAAEDDKPRILIVDDSPIELAYFGQLLAAEGYAVETAPDGASCLDVLEGKPADLVLMDVVMPLLDGYETCGRIKADPRWSGIPVIFLSSLERGSDRARAFSTGAADFVAKTIDPAELLARIRTQLQAAADRRRGLARADQLERRIGNRTAELRTLIDSLPDLVWLKDRDGVYRECNRRFERFFGAPRERIIGKTDYDFVDRGLADFFREKDRRALEAGGPTVNEEEVTFGDDGHRELLETIKTPVVGADGEVLGVLGIGRDITDRKKAEEKLLRSLEEKDALIRELYHRTKNTLQLISAVVSLQAERADDATPKVLAKKVETRIKAISMVHEMLYESRDLSRIPIRGYIGALAVMIIDAADAERGKIALETDVEDQSVLIDTAVPLGLMLVELLSNSILHAFPGKRTGKISIGLSRSGPGFNELRYSDDGIGLPRGFSLSDCGSLGMQLIRTLGEGQLGGAMHLEDRGGFQLTFTFPDDLYEERV
jgi:PAS domain S-box-containing protein